MGHAHCTRKNVPHGLPIALELCIGCALGSRCPRNVSLMVNPFCCLRASANAFTDKLLSSQQIWTKKYIIYKKNVICVNKLSFNKSIFKYLFCIPISKSIFVNFFSWKTERRRKRKIGELCNFSEKYETASKEMNKLMKILIEMMLNSI